MRQFLPLRLTTTDGDTMFRGTQSMEHGELCRLFNLDPVRHRWDLSGSALAMRPGNAIPVGAVECGYLMREGKPVGVLHVVREGERLRDLDPMDPRDQLSLRQAH